MLIRLLARTIEMCHTNRMSLPDREEERDRARQEMELAIAHAVNYLHLDLGMSLTS